VLALNQPSGHGTIPRQGLRDPQPQLSTIEILDVKFVI